MLGKTAKPRVLMSITIFAKIHIKLQVNDVTFLAHEIQSTVEMKKKRKFTIYFVIEMKRGESVNYSRHNRVAKFSNQTRTQISRGTMKKRNKK